MTPPPTFDFNEVKALTLIFISDVVKAACLQTAVINSKVNFAHVRDGQVIGIVRSVMGDIVMLVRRRI